MKRSTLKQREIEAALNARLPVNPFKRIRERSGYTQEVMADKVGISKQALIRAEQGTYSAPLPALLSFYVNNFGENEYELDREYEQFQHDMRAQNYLMFGQLPDNYYAHVHPFRTIRKNYNCTEVAKMLCIPQATLTYFERKARRQKSVPKLLVEVLREIGYSHTSIVKFDQAYQAHREYLNGKR